ncbi:hypothetical protein Q3G72_032867 [Acer saccharum]|nr:hypothetical protein Q3G72_032867 [Acer saccharum]
MADIFMFSAQPEHDNNEGAPIKPLDPMASAKRAHASNEVGDEILRRPVDNIVQNEEAKAPEKEKDLADDKSEPYGPWMHVSYGKFGKNNVNSNQAGKKNGSSGKNNGGFKYANRYTNFGTERYGNVDNGSTSASDLPAYEVESTGLVMGNTRENGKLSVGGSQGKTSNKKVLAEISNRTFVNIKHSNSTANKYLVNHNIEKGTISKTSKENVRGLGVKKIGKGSKQSISNSISMQSHDMDDAREDSDSYSTSGAEPSDSNSSMVQKVVVSDETNLEAVASKLKEAMEIVLE